MRGNTIGRERPVGRYDKADGSSVPGPLKTPWDRIHRRIPYSFLLAGAFEIGAVANECAERKFGRTSRSQKASRANERVGAVSETLPVRTFARKLDTGTSSRPNGILSGRNTCDAREKSWHSNRTGRDPDSSRGLACVAGNGIWRTAGPGIAGRRSSLLAVGLFGLHLRGGGR